MSSLFLCFSVFVTVSAANPVDKVKNAIQIEGPLDEGCKDNRNSAKTGSVHCFLTYPGEININQLVEGTDASQGTLTYSFECRKRVKDYKLGGETDTTDYQRPGVVSAEYVYFGGKVAISDVSRTAEGRCGSSVESKLRNF
jgi:hypothetical protein